jgi:hypothetical protein
MANLTDTSPEAERVLREAYRKMTFAQKWRQMGAIYHTARVLHEAGIRVRDPAATAADVERAWRCSAGIDPSLQIGSDVSMAERDDNLRVIQEVVGVLDRLGIPYALGGSWASSLLGKMRFTHDADINVDPFPGKEVAFCAAFGEDYYVDLTSVQLAVRNRSSVNVIHTVSGFKVDLFVRKERPFDQSLMARRRPVPLPETPGQSIACLSPEDVVLIKLEWYRLGGESSEQQMKDVRGVLEVQAERLDQGYLDHWAGELGVADLLARARQESGT